MKYLWLVGTLTFILLGIASVVFAFCHISDETATNTILGILGAYISLIPAWRFAILYKRLAT